MKLSSSALWTTIDLDDWSEAEEFQNPLVSSTILVLKKENLVEDPNKITDFSCPTS